MLYEVITRGWKQWQLHSGIALLAGHLESSCKKIDNRPAGAPQAVRSRKVSASRARHRKRHGGQNAAAHDRDTGCLSTLHKIRVCSTRPYRPNNDPERFLQCKPRLRPQTPHIFQLFWITYSSVTGRRKFCLKLKCEHTIKHRKLRNNFV